MNPLLVLTWLPPDGTGLDALALVRRLLRRAGQDQPALPEGVAPSQRGRPPNILPDCAAERLATALGVAVLRHSLLSVATAAPPGPEAARLAERGLLLVQVPFRDPVRAARGLVGRGARGWPVRGLPGAATAAEAQQILLAAAPALEEWLGLPGALAVDLDQLAASPADVLALVMDHLGIEAESEEEVPAFLAEWSARKTILAETDAGATALSAEEEAEIRAALGPVYERCRAAAAAAAAALAPPAPAQSTIVPPEA